MRGETITYESCSRRISGPPISNYKMNNSPGLEYVQQQLQLPSYVIHIQRLVLQGDKLLLYSTAGFPLVRDNELHNVVLSL